MTSSCGGRAHQQTNPGIGLEGSVPDVLPECLELVHDDCIEYLLNYLGSTGGNEYEADGGGAVDAWGPRGQTVETHTAS